MTITLEKFLSLLQSGNANADDLGRVNRKSTSEDFQDPGVLAWWLVEQNSITRGGAHAGFRMEPPSSATNSSIGGCRRHGDG